MYNKFYLSNDNWALFINDDYLFQKIEELTQQSRANGNDSTWNLPEPELTL